MITDFPQKDKRRAIRRKEKQKRLREAKEIAHRIFPDHPEWEEQWAKRHADNLKACSCWMCGNPRRVFHDETLQEKKFSESMKCD